MAVKFIDGIKLYSVREFAMMRDGQIIVKLADKEGHAFWTDTDCLEVFVG